MIDGGVFIDRDPTQEIGDGVDDVMRRLDRFGVDRALAASFKAVYFDYREGNEETRRACARTGDRLLPMAVVNLLGYDSGDDYLARVKADGFMALALFPHMQYWSWSDYVAQKIACQAAELGLPLQAGLRTRRDLADVARHVAPAGGSVLVRWMHGSGYNNVPDIIATGQDFPNLYFDVSNVTQSGGIELLVGRLGAERLYLASNIPLVLEGAPYFLLRAAHLSAEQRRLIEGGTLARVLGLPEPKRATPPPEIWETMRRAPKIDTHWHTSGWNLIEPRLDFATMSKEFDSFNYQLAVSSSIRALNHDLATGNAETLAFAESDPRVRGLVVVNPCQVEASLAELAKYRDDPRFVGVKSIQDFYGKELDDPGYAAIFEHVRDIPDWPVMAHLPGLRRAAEAFPDLNFVAAHSTWRYWEFKGLDNVWFDIATSSALRQEVDLRGLVEAVGADRVIFSCDGQLMNSAWTLGKMASSDLPADVVDKILRFNALAAFPRLKLATV